MKKMMGSKMRAFLTFRLGDNDFSHYLLRTVQYLSMEYDLKTCDLQWLRTAAVAILRGYSTANSGEDSGEYLDKKLTVSETGKDEDVDHGACSIDLNTGFIWTH